MTEIVKPGILHHAARRKLKPLDIVIFVVVLAVLVFLAVKLVSSLALKNEVSAAQHVSDQVITDISKQDAEEARKRGDADFQAKNSTAQLKQVFANVSKLTSGSPTIEKRTVANDSKQDAVYIIYRYSGKTPYYIRVGTAKEAGTWYLANLSGSTDLSNLILK